MSERRRFNRSERIALYLSQDGKCALCGVELSKSWHGDHIEPWSHGGPTDVINGQALCPTCNLKKGNQMEDKRPLRDWQREALNLYDQHQGKIFLVDACPAAGKTRLIAEINQRDLFQGKSSAIVGVVPSADLRTQMADDFHAETGIQLDPNWNGVGVPLLHGEYKGVVVTYSWLAKNSALMRRMVSKQSTFVFCDEIHHAQKERAWGEALEDAFDQPTTKLLLTTGTPFTSEGNPISFINYDAKGQAIANYSINYGRALAAKIVRALIFNHHQGEMVWDDEDGTKTHTFADRLSKRDRGRRLNTAIHSDNEHVRALIQKALHKLRELREDDHDAAMLLIAKNQDEAEEIAKIMKQEFGITPIIAISKDGKAASGAIKAFKHSEEMCIIAVDMISEGINIPRIRVICYATNVTTFLYFMQVLGRAMRTELGHDDHTAYVFTPDDERFREFAIKIMRECDEALSKEKGPGGDGPGPIDWDSIWFQPKSASFTDAVAVVNGVHLNAEELAIGVARKTAKSSAYATLSAEYIALVLKLETDPTAGDTNETQTNHREPHQTEKPLYEKLADVRQFNDNLVKRLYYALKGAVEFPEINYRLNTAVGIGSVKKCFDLDKLQRRYDLAKRWLTKKIEPEVSFND